jgi:hypothetical protein
MMLAVVWLAACARPAPPPTPTLAPAPTPAATPVPTTTSGPQASPTGAPATDPATADIQDAFLENVNDLTAEVESLATLACDDLASETRDNPTEVTEIRGFAATLQRIGTTQAALNTDDVRSALSDLTKAVTQLDVALNTCGIKTS